MTASGRRRGEMRLGLLPPFTPQTIANSTYLAELGPAIEQAGAESIWTVEHILVAEDYEPRYPYSADGRMPGGGKATMPDPLQVLACVGAHTSTLRLGTSVVIATQHPAVILAKTVATLDALTGGRVVLGVGIGWQIEEYQAIGVPYEKRGRRLDETIGAVRSLWGPGPSSYQGDTVSFDRVHVDPKPAHSGGVPIVIGGSSAAAARRAGRMGDGWFPYVVGPDEVAAGMATIRASAEAAGRDPDDVEVTVWPGSWDLARGTDPTLFAELAALGVDRIVVAAHEAGGPTNAAHVAEFVARMRTMLDGVSS